jgi:hypothetical protein
MDEVLFRAVDASLKRSARFSGPVWQAFEPVVGLGLAIVEAEAVRGVEQEGVPRGITQEDRQRAAWRVVKRAIECLRPVDLNEEVRDALLGLPVIPWPQALPVPWELAGHLVLAGRYLWRRSVSELAELLHVGNRTVANIRLRALRSVTIRIAAWEKSSRS